MAHFCTQVVKFIFAGRNSGQQESETSPAFKCRRTRTDSRAALRWAARPSIAALGVVNYHVLGDGKYAGLPLELDPVGGIRRKFDFAGFCAQPGDDVTNRTASTKLGQQQSSVGQGRPIS